MSQDITGFFYELLIVGLIHKPETAIKMNTV